MRSGKVDCERNDPPMYATLSTFAPDRTFSVSEGSTNVPAATDPSSRSITNCGNTNLGGNSFLVMQPRKDTIKSTFTSVSNDNHVSSSVVQPSSISYHIRSEKERPLVQLSRHLIQNFLRINTNYHKKGKATHDNTIYRKKKLVVKETDDEYPLSSEEEIFNGRYRVHGKRVGLGSFGQVVEGIDLKTGEKVAIKIIKKKRNFLAQAQTEISVLEVLHRQEHPGRKMIVHLKCSFLHKGFQCLVFELLSYNLYELIRCTQYFGIGFNLLRKIARQILQAMEYMAHPNINVIHCDLKPENILLVHPRHSQIKIIDFGSSCVSHEQLYQYIQSRYYRAPEVLLGMKYTFAVDMWSLGCILVEMHTAKPLFEGVDQHDQLRRITQVLGMFPQSFIEQTPSTYRREYFDETSVAEGDRILSQYRLKDCKAFGRGHKERPRARPLYETLGVDIGGPDGRRRGDPNHTRNDYLCFLDLIRRMLEYNPVDRICPSEALQHPFLKTGSSSFEVNKKSKCMRSTAPFTTYNGDYGERPIGSNRVKQRRL
uniref:Dual specificity tyrosinephosphorylationregulated kinase putative n=1 Tax=Albugo laibachii Nc14 TaxID=890382 RepID=F0W4T0_9STRA|nr:dual specificity tyrosinephosphorylationregulated kinase putative [Albugo laibachii Nc14]|eukprot:CCA16116.1 dual specificity tyrosinephosphorylationregulated kinase putative [Albugo laibachii Nc14]